MTSVNEEKRTVIGDGLGRQKGPMDGKGLGERRKNQSHPSGISPFLTPMLAEKRLEPPVNSYRRSLHFLRLLYRTKSLDLRMILTGWVHLA
jgi:hypothetical protein